VPKSGRQRKTKRRAKEKAEARLVNLLNGDDYYQEDHEENALVRHSVRWNTEELGRYADKLNLKQLREEVNNGKLSAKTIAMIVTRRAMVCSDEKISVSAVKNLLSMEGQNQKDTELELRKELASKIPSQHPLQVNIQNTNAQQVNIQDAIHQLVEDDNEYLNYLRQRAIEEDSKSCLVGKNGKEGLPNTQTSSVYRQGGNGSSNGTNGSSDPNH